MNNRTQQAFIYIYIYIGVGYLFIASMLNSSPAISSERLMFKLDLVSARQRIEENILHEAIDCSSLSGRSYRSDIRFNDILHIRLFGGSLHIFCICPTSLFSA